MSNTITVITMWVIELVFAVSALFLLHKLRGVLGSAAFVTLLGVFMFTGIILYAGNLELEVSKTLPFALQLPVGLSLILPCMAAVLLTYITQGTLVTQRIMVAQLAGCGGFLYVCKLTLLQMNWLAVNRHVVGDIDLLEQYLQQIWHQSISILLCLFLLTFTLPICYTMLRKLQLPQFFSAVFTYIINISLFLGCIVLLHYNCHRYFAEKMLDFIPVGLTAAIILAALTCGYLKLIEQEADKVVKAAPLEILFAFLGGYGRSKMLERNIFEWENRHQAIMQNASDMIVLMDAAGNVTDANFSALRTLKCNSVEQLMHSNFWPLCKLENVVRTELLDYPDPLRSIRRKITLPLADKQEVVMDAVVSVIFLKEQPMLLLMGRDITAETRLAAERTTLAEQVSHLQRLEALGKLTGGIAHDFNNYIHAILGHLDLLELKFTNPDPSYLAHLHKIADVAEQAGKLTRQLLGFARKGKYQIVEIDLRELVSRSAELFLPNKIKDIDLRVLTGDIPLNINGDLVQLQQVMLNLLFNALDALKNNPPSFPPQLELICGLAAHAPIAPELPLTIGANSPPVDINNYYFVMVRDNGCGMDKATLEHALDPFFTTKSVGEGTGMGLPMVYGAVTHHYGWLQIKSKLGIGTTVLLFLPKAEMPPTPIQAEVKF